MSGASSRSGILVLARRDQTSLSFRESFRTMRSGGTIGLPQTRKKRKRMENDEGGYEDEDEDEMEE